MTCGGADGPRSLVSALGIHTVTPDICGHTVVLGNSKPTLWVNRNAAYCAVPLIMHCWWFDKVGYRWSARARCRGPLYSSPSVS